MPEAGDLDDEALALTVLTMLQGEPEPGLDEACKYMQALEPDDLYVAACILAGAYQGVYIAMERLHDQLDEEEE